MYNIVFFFVLFVGYYCNGSIIFVNFFDGFTGGGCFLGYYCFIGISVFNVCLMGYYLDMIFSSVVLVCKICKFGKY